MAEKEIEKWVTVKGKHVPIYKDSKKKQSSVVKNLDKQSFEKGGTYSIYRAGEPNSKSPLVFFTPSKDDAYYYSLFSDREEGKFDEYEISYSSPLVVSGTTDRERLKTAWQVLHPEDELKPQEVMSTAQLAKWWQRLDRQNATALKKQGYDALVLKDSKTNKVVEVQLLAKTAKMKKNRSVTYKNKKE